MVNKRFIKKALKARKDYEKTFNDIKLFQPLKEQSIPLIQCFDIMLDFIQKSETKI